MRRWERTKAIGCIVLAIPLTIGISEFGWWAAGRVLEPEPAPWSPPPTRNAITLNPGQSARGSIIATNGVSLVEGYQIVTDSRMGFRIDGVDVTCVAEITSDGYVRWRRVEDGR